MAAYKGSKLSDGTPLNVAVYKAYRNAGLSHNQALAVTAEVGRENSFSAGTLFGNHTDPAATKGGKPIRNLGMLSWNQGRDKMLEDYLVKNGVMKNGVMAQNQANLNAQAAFSVREMKSPRYAGKLKNFWNNPNANPDVYARELGKHYIAWAYGQDTIKAKGGGRKPFDWRKHDNRRRGHLNTLAGMLGGKTNYQAQAQQPTFQLPQRRPLSELLAENNPPRPTFRMPERRPLAELLANNGAAKPFVLPERRPLSELLSENNQVEQFSLPERKPLAELLGNQNSTEPTQQAEQIPEIPQRRPLAELLAEQASTNETMPNLELQEWQI